jgi:molecular chaperone GrpE
MTMSDEKKDRLARDPSGAPGAGRESPEEEAPIVVRDRRFWARGAEEAAGKKPPRTSPLPSLLEELQKKAQTSEAELQKATSASRRTREETDSKQKRVQRDFELRVQRATGDVLRELLQVTDYLSLALRSGEQTRDLDGLLEGVRMVKVLFLQILERQGLERIETEGRPFDPNVAEAVGLDPVEEPSLDGIVLSEEQPSYRFRGELLRPGRVRVGRHGLPAPEEPAVEEAEQPPPAPPEPPPPEAAEEVPPAADEAPAPELGEPPAPPLPPAKGARREPRREEPEGPPVSPAEIDFEEDLGGRADDDDLSWGDGGPQEP